MWTTSWRRKRKGSLNQTNHRSATNHNALTAMRITYVFECERSEASGPASSTQWARMSLIRGEIRVPSCDSVWRDRAGHFIVQVAPRQSLCSSAERTRRGCAVWSCLPLSCVVGRSRWFEFSFLDSQGGRVVELPVALFAPRPGCTSCSCLCGFDLRRTVRSLALCVLGTSLFAADAWCGVEARPAGSRLGVSIRLRAAVCWSLRVVCRFEPIPTCFEQAGRGSVSRCVDATTAMRTASRLVRERFATSGSVFSTQWARMSHLRGEIRIPSCDSVLRARAGHFYCPSGPRGSLVFRGWRSCGTAALLCCVCRCPVLLVCAEPFALVRALVLSNRSVDELWSRQSLCLRRGQAALPVRACVGEICGGLSGL
jgi:hypothetical protein